MLNAHAIKQNLVVGKVGSGDGSVASKMKISSVEHAQEMTGRFNEHIGCDPMQLVFRKQVFVERFEAAEDALLEFIERR